MDSLDKDNESRQYALNWQVKRGLKPRDTAKLPALDEVIRLLSLRTTSTTVTPIQHTGSLCSLNYGLFSENIMPPELFYKVFWKTLRWSKLKFYRSSTIFRIESFQHWLALSLLWINYTQKGTGDVITCERGQKRSKTLVVCNTIT